MKDTLEVETSLREMAEEILEAEKTDRIWIL